MTDGYGRHTFDDESTVGGMSRSFQELAEESEVRIVPAKKREPNNESSVLPKLFPKEPSPMTTPRLSSPVNEDVSVGSDDSDEHRKNAIVDGRDSFGDGLDREVHRVVKRKDARRVDAKSSIVPKV